MLSNALEWVAHAITDSLDWVIENISVVVLGIGILAIAAMFIATIFDDSLSDSQAAAACLRKGYPDYRIASEWFDQTVYCVRLENGTERVVPLNGE